MFRRHLCLFERGVTMWIQPYFIFKYKYDVFIFQIKTISEIVLQNYKNTNL